MRDGLADQDWTLLRAAMLGTLGREVNALTGVCCWEHIGARSSILPMRFNQCLCWSQRSKRQNTMYLAGPSD
jgi:hypothetical protein